MHLLAIILSIAFAQASHAQIAYTPAGTYQVTHSVTLANAGGAEVWVPVPVDGPGQRIEGLKVEPEGAELLDDDTGQTRIARLILGREVQDAKLTVSYAVHCERPDFDKTALAQLEPGPYDTNSPEYRAYTTSQSRLECDDPRIVEVAKGFTSEVNPYRRAWAIYSYVIDRCSYSDAPGRGALPMLQTKVGCCADYSNLFVAICRATGIPARECSGFTVKGTGTWHSWAEFYIPQVGWIPCDPQAGDGPPESRQAAFAGLVGPDCVALAKQHDITITRGGRPRTAPVIQDSMIWGGGRSQSILNVVDISPCHYGVLLTAGTQSDLQLDLTKEALIAASEAARADGRACLSVAMQPRQGTIVYAAAFGPDKHGGRWQLYPEMARAQYDALLHQAGSARVMPVSLASCHTDAGPLFTAVLADDGGRAWQALTALPQGEFMTRVQSLVKAGKCPAVLACHDDRTDCVCSAVFVDLTPGTGLSAHICAPEGQFLSELERYEAEGHFPSPIAAAGKYPPSYTVVALKGVQAPAWDVVTDIAAETLEELRADWQARGYGVQSIWAY